MQKMVEFAIEKLNEDMSTQEIADAWDNIKYGIAILVEAARNRLEALGFDDEDYEDGSNAEIDQLLELHEQLDNAISYY